MKETKHKFLLAGDKFMSKCIKDKPIFQTVVDHLLKTKKEYINLKKHKIQDIFIEAI